MNVRADGCDCPRLQRCTGTPASTLAGRPASRYNQCAVQIVVASGQLRLRNWHRALNAWLSGFDSANTRGNYRLCVTEALDRMDVAEVVDINAAHLAEYRRWVGGRRLASSTKYI